jgi:hypothetical protein
MNNDLPAGILLSSNVLQPFFLRFHRDDLHVMAFIEGHPQYECVEAMIKHRADGASNIRAIITLHDQSQFDHINNETGLLQMRGAKRHVCSRQIALETGVNGDKRRARIAFVSHAGEAIDLDVTTIDLPNRARAGLSDPGGHSATSALPMMWRGASSLAGPESRVLIDGQRFGLRPKLHGGAVVAYEGYYTEGHSMGVLRAGEVDLKLLRKPDHLELGAEWMFETAERTITYRISDQSHDGAFRIAKLDESREVITAYAADERLRLMEICLPADDDATRGLVLSFEEPGCFRFDMEGTRALVSGRAEVAVVPKQPRIRLQPLQPAWAAKRGVSVECSASGDRLRVVTTIDDIAAHFT